MKLLRSKGLKSWLVTASLAFQQRALLIQPDISVANHLLLPEFSDEQARRMLLRAAGVDQADLVAADHFFGPLDSLGRHAANLLRCEHLVGPGHAGVGLDGSDSNAGGD